MIRLTKRQVLMMHEELIAQTGGSPGMRDEGLLEAALAAPFMTFGGTDLYATVEEKAACLAFGLLKITRWSTATNVSASTRCSCFWN